MNQVALCLGRLTNTSVYIQYQVGIPTHRWRGFLLNGGTDSPRPRQLPESGDSMEAVPLFTGGSPLRSLPRPMRAGGFFCRDVPIIPYMCFLCTGGFPSRPWFIEGETPRKKSIHNHAERAWAGIALDAGAPGVGVGELTCSVGVILQTVSMPLGNWSLVG